MVYLNFQNSPTISVSNKAEYKMVTKQYLEYRPVVPVVKNLEYKLTTEQYIKYILVAKQSK